MTMAKTKKAPVPKPKRAPGTGSYYQRADGRWVADITLGWQTDPQTGKRKRLHDGGYFRTEREAKAWLDKANYEVSQSTYISPSTATMRQYLGEWLEDVVRPVRTYNTYTSYSSMVRNHIIPHVGTIALQKLTSGQVQAMWGALLADGASPCLVGKVRTVLHIAWKHALSFGYVQRDVVAPTITPKAHQEEMHVLTRAQAELLLDSVRAHPHWSTQYAAYSLALVLGLRVSEYLGIRWQDIDFDRGTLSVRGALQRQTGSGLVWKAPKSKAGVRTIQLPQVCRTALLARRAEQERQRSSRAWQHDYGYVFTTRSGRPISSSVFRVAFNNLVLQSGLPDYITVHSMRHTAVVTMLQSGIPVKTVAHMVGHKSVATTLNLYSHVLDTMKEDATGKLDEMWG